MKHYGMNSMNNINKHDNINEVGQDNKHDILILLQNEILNHPKLCEQLEQLYDENDGKIDFIDKLKVISAYCEMPLDGTYVVGELCEQLYRILKSASRIIH